MASAVTRCVWRRGCACPLTAFVSRARRLKDTDLAAEEDESFLRLDKDGNGSLSVDDLRAVRVAQLRDFGAWRAGVLGGIRHTAVVTP